jgi:hypothetical protein
MIVCGGMVVECECVLFVRRRRGGAVYGVGMVETLEGLAGPVPPSAPVMLVSRLRFSMEPELRKLDAHAQIEENKSAALGGVREEGIAISRVAELRIRFPFQISEGCFVLRRRIAAR